MNIKPTFEEAAEIGKAYKTIPLSAELKMDVTPLQVLKKLKKISSHCYMLESCEDTDNWGRYTFLGYDPKAEISSVDYNVTVTDADGVMKYNANPARMFRSFLMSTKVLNLIIFQPLQADL